MSTKKKIKRMEQNMVASRHGKKMWKRVVGVLSCLVVFVTTYALILPAITLTPDPICGIEEHAHTEACYGAEAMMLCGLEETEGHQHGESCYETCLELSCTEESEEHSHEDSCYTEENALVCVLAEVEPHTHTEDCSEQVLICEKQEHEHSDDCYSKSDENSDSVWISKLPAPIGNWAADVLAAAKSQMGYAESTEDTQDGNGRTLYGDNYGMPYGKWDAAFASWLLMKMEVPGDIPQSADTYEWINALAEANLLRIDEPDYQPGDLLFFFDDDYELRVGIVAESGTTESVRLILGDRNHQVVEEAFLLEDLDQAGWVRLSQDEEPNAPEDNSFASDLPVVGTVWTTPRSGAMILSATPYGDLPAEGQLDLATVRSATMYYASADSDPSSPTTTWMRIKEDTHLTGNEHIRLDISYEKLDPDDLKENNYTMLFRLPKGLERCNTNGTLTIGDRIVGTISTTGDDPYVTLRYDHNYVEEVGNSWIEGDFRITAELDAGALDGEDKPTIHVGDLDITFELPENDMLAKYGEISLDKELSSSRMISENGKYYLDYTLTVTAGPYGAHQITVRDHFKDTTAVAAFVGVPTNSASSSPKDERISGTAVENAIYPGSVTMDNGDMLWTVGNMGPDEVRRLTYRVELTDTYTSIYHNNTLDNTATVSSKTYERNSSTAHFNPQVNMGMTKTVVGDPRLNSNGTYTVNYQLVVVAYDNDYTLTNVRIDDAFEGTDVAYDEDVRYVRNSFFCKDGTPDSTATHRQLTDPTFKNTGTNGREYFEGLYIGDMAPNTTKTITYQAEVSESAFVHAGNGTVTVKNVAKVFDDDKKHGESSPIQMEQANASVDIGKKQWSRKFAGEGVADENGINEVMDEIVYHIPFGAKKYEIIVNEDGGWNVNGATFVDVVPQGYPLEFIGKVKIEAYEIIDTNRPAEGASNSAALEAIRQSQPADTKWQDIDGQTRFSITPTDLGFESSKNYAYVLTYYAKKAATASTESSVEVKNDFTLSGSVVGPNGSYSFHTSGVKVTSTTTMVNKDLFTAKKQAWYYEKPGEGLSGFQNGAFYWIIRVDAATLRQGLIIQDSSNIGSYKHYNHIGGDGTQSSFVGVYVGDLGYQEINGQSRPNQLMDIYPDAEALVSSVVDQKGDGYLRFVDYEFCTGKNLSSGNSPIEVYFGGNIAQAPDSTQMEPDKGKAGVERGGIRIYNHDLNVRVREDYTTIPGESMYIIVRTEPMILPESSEDVFEFKNKFNWSRNDGENWPSTGANVVSQTLYGSDNIKKTVTYPKVYGVVTNKDSIELPGKWGAFQGIQGAYALDGTLLKSHLIGKDVTKGYFTLWNVRVNCQGELRGAYRVKEIIPEGMEIAYIRLAGRGSNTATGEITFKQIRDLGPEWEEHSVTPSSSTGASGKGNMGSAVDPNEKPVVYYYTNGNEVIWEVDGLKYGTDTWVDFQVATQIVDEAAVQGQPTTFNNTAQLMTTANHVINQSAADVTLDITDHITKEHVAAENSSGYNSSTLNFTIVVNPQMLPNDDRTIADLNPNGSSVNLVDEMSEFLIIDPASVVVREGNKNKNGNIVTGYTVEISNNGHTMTIRDLPDDKTMTVYYSTTVDARPGVSTKVSNTAHWEGVATPDESAKDDFFFVYTSAGSVSQSPQLKIHKVDPTNAQGELLGGATFQLQAVMSYDNGAFQATAGTVYTHTTEANKELVFGAQTTGENAEPMSYNMVYKLVETKAPEGFVLDKTPYYFIVAKAIGYDDTGNPVYPDYAELLKDTVYEKAYVYYNGPVYTYTAYNHKGQIEVTKAFGGNVSGDTPVPGTYYFGLYETMVDGAPVGKPIYTTSITYSVGDVGASGNKTAVFSDLPLNKTFYLFETDADGNAIVEGGILFRNDEKFTVSYDKHQVVCSSDAQGSDSVTVTNSRYHASVTKRFSDIGGNILMKGMEGTYTFGIWETGAELTAQNCLDVQMITWEKTETVGSKTATFIGLDPAKSYSIYELSVTGSGENAVYTPIESNGTVFINAIQYAVKYGETGNSTGCLSATTTIPNVDVTNSASVSLPNTGGAGTRTIYLVGAMLLLTALTALGLPRRRREG